MTPRCRKLETKDKSDWLAKRLNFITATDVGTILGKNQYDTREALIGDKLFGKAPIIYRTHIDRGVKAEPFLIQAFAEQYRVPVRAPLGFLVSTRYPWLACTPDAIGRIDGATHLLEIKAPAKPWREVPQSYIWQVKAQLMVTGIARGLLVYGQFDDKTNRVSNIKTQEVTLSKFDEKQIEVECHRVWRIIQDLRPIIEAVRYKHEAA